MRVFIAGATGILGLRAVRRLVEHGYQVVGLSRSEANVDLLNRNGAQPRQGDLFNQEEIVSLTSDSDAILHLATAIPTKARTSLADWQMNDRIRREGTRNLVEAAIRNKCRLYIQESITLLYGERNGDWVDEGAEIPSRQPAILESARDMEAVVWDAMQERGLPAIILRLGSLYGHDSAQTQAMFQLAQGGNFPIVGDGSTYWNNINADDAVEAIIKAIENHQDGLGRVFNVCDDEPVQYGELVRFVTEKVGGRKPRHIPRFLARLMLGSHLVDAIFASMRCKNDLIRETLGWRPGYPTYREGYQVEIDRWLGS